MSHLRSNLARYQPRTMPLNDGELRAMAAVCWQRFGIVCMRPEELTNEFDRQAVINAAVAIYGERSCK